MVQYLEPNSIELLLKGLFKDRLLYPRVSEKMSQRQVVNDHAYGPLLGERSLMNL